MLLSVDSSTFHPLHVTVIHFREDQKGLTLCYVTFVGNLPVTLDVAHNTGGEMSKT